MNDEELQEELALEFESNQSGIETRVHGSLLGTLPRV